MAGQNFLVALSLVAYPFVVYSCFSTLGPRRGLLASLLGGWLFLPSFDAAFGSRVPLIHTKAAFVPAVVLVVALLRDRARWARFRPRRIDIPVAVLCMAPVLASLANDLGLYDGASTALSTTMTWGVPFLMGRLYFSKPGMIDDLADAMVLAALAYVPLCLWEIRMSPNLHRLVFGYSPFGTDFTQVMRFGGYRPSVFMADGLMAAMFMAAAALVATWMWRTRSRQRLAGLPISAVAGILLVTTLLCKSTGAIVLLALGLGALEVTRRSRTSVLILAIAALPPLYCSARLVGWSGDRLADEAEKLFGAERADSMRFRMENEDILIEKAMQRPWTGWGGWGRSRVYNAEGKDLTVTDGLWVLALGTTGLVGLLAIWATLIAPVLAMLRVLPGRFWADPRVAPAAALAMVLIVWVIDDIFNAMVIPVYPMIAGALASLGLAAAASRSLRPVPRGAAALVNARMASRQGHGN